MCFILNQILYCSFLPNFKVKFLEQSILCKSVPQEERTSSISRNLQHIMHTQIIWEVAMKTRTYTKTKMVLKNKATQPQQEQLEKCFHNNVKDKK